MTAPVVQQFNSLLAKGDVDALRSLMQAHPPGTFDLNRENRYGYSMFQRLLLAKHAPTVANSEAAEARDQEKKERTLQLIRFLVSQLGTDMINHVSGMGTALHVAIDQGNPEMVRELIALGADCLKCNKQDWTPLAVAFKRGNMEIIDMLMTAQGQFFDADNKLAVNVIKHNHQLLAKLLAEKKIDLTTADKAGFTLAHVCALGGRADIFQALLDHADRSGISSFLTATTNKNCTPLHLACKKNSIEIIEILLKRPEVDINAQDVNSWTPLMYAVAAGHVQAVERLLQVPACDPNAKTKGNHTVLMVAVTKLVPCLDALLKRTDIDLNAADEQGWTALHIAARRADARTVGLLAEDSRCNVNAKTKNTGLAPVHIATKRGELDVLKALLSSGRCDPNQPTTNHGWTSMHIAARDDKIDVFRVLRAFGADPTIKDQDGKTPVHKAFAPSKNRWSGRRNFSEWRAELSGLEGLLSEKKRKRDDENDGNGDDDHKTDNDNDENAGNDGWVL